MERYEIDAEAISAGPPGSYLGDQNQANKLPSPNIEAALVPRLAWTPA